MALLDTSYVRNTHASGERREVGKARGNNSLGLGDKEARKLPRGNWETEDVIAGVSGASGHQCLDGTGHEGNSETQGCPFESMHGHLRKKLPCSVNR